MAEKGLSKKTYWIYGIGVSYFILDQIYNQWLSYYYLPPANEQTLKPLLTPILLILAFIFGRIIDAVTDPLVGYLSDNSKSKYGRRSFFMLLGGLPLALTMILFFFPLRSSIMATFLWVALINGLFFTAYTLVGGPYNALIPDLAKTKEDRLNLSTVQSVFRLIFTAVAMILPGYFIARIGNGNTEKGIRATVVIFTILGVLGVYLCAFMLNEKELTKNREEHKHIKFKDSVKHIFEKEIVIYFIAFFLFFSGFNILRGIVNYYVVSIMELSVKSNTTISALLFGAAALAFPFTNKLAKKYTYKKVLIGDIILLIIGTVGLLFVTKENRILAYPLFILCGLGLSGSAFIFPLTIISDLAVSLGERKNISVEGIMFGIQGMFLKLAFLTQQIVQTTLLVRGSKTLGNGFKKETKMGVYSTLIAAIVLFSLSLVFYSMKKEEK